MLQLEALEMIFLFTGFLVIGVGFLVAFARNSSIAGKKVDHRKEFFRLVEAAREAEILEKRPISYNVAGIWKGESDGYFGVGKNLEIQLVQNQSDLAGKVIDHFGYSEVRGFFVWPYIWFDFERHGTVFEFRGIIKETPDGSSIAGKYRYFMEDAEWHVKRIETFAPKTPAPAKPESPKHTTEEAPDATPSQAPSAAPNLVPQAAASERNVVVSNDGVSVSATEVSGNMSVSSVQPINATPGVLKPAIAKTAPPKPAVQKPEVSKQAAPQPARQKPKPDSGGWKQVDFTPEELKLLDARSLPPESEGAENVMETGARRIAPEDFPVLPEFPPIDEDRIKPVPRGDTHNAPYVRGKSGKCPTCKSDLEEFISFCIYCGTKKEN